MPVRPAQQPEETQTEPTPETVPPTPTPEEPTTPPTPEETPPTEETPRTTSEGGVKYTGRAHELVYDGKVYATPSLFAKAPKGTYDGSFDDAIAGMTKEKAAHMMASSGSNLHAFEADGEPVEPEPEPTY